MDDRRNDSRPTPRGQMQPYSSASTQSQNASGKSSLLRDLVRQSFDVFNLYGKQPEALANIVQGFSLALEDQSVEDIRRAFMEWLNTNSTMPTPADIRNISAEFAKNRSFMSSRSEPARPAHIARSGNLDPWCGKQYADASKDGTVGAYFARYKDKPESFQEYGYEWLRYACDFLGYPKDILPIFRKETGLPVERKVHPSSHLPKAA